MTHSPSLLTQIVRSPTILAEPTTSIVFAEMDRMPTLVPSKRIVVELGSRRLQPEIMDQPDLDSAEHQHALSGLRRVNALSFSNRVFWSHIVRRSQRTNGRPLRVLDLACGGGDVGLGLAKRAARCNIDIEITGWDISPVAINSARDLAASAECKNVRFIEGNALCDPIRNDFDIIMCSLFMHHLEPSQSVELLKKMGEATQGDVLVNDLRRTRLGYWLAWFGCRVLTRSYIVHYDGPTSVEGAFTIEEAKKLCTLAGLSDAKITPFWPERFLIAWSRP